MPSNEYTMRGVFGLGTISAIVNLIPDPPTPEPDPEPEQTTDSTRYRCMECGDIHKFDGEEQEISRARRDMYNRYAQVISAGHMCPTCWVERDEDEFFVCGYCGQTFDRNLMGIETNENDEPVCVVCRDRHYMRCYDCGGYFTPSRMETDHLCMSCFSDSYFYCEGCENACHVDNYARDGYCVDCVNDNCSDVLHDYDYRPFNGYTFHGDYGPYYGIELETDDYDERRYAAESLIDNDPAEQNYFMKEDGSLNCGIEIVFQPRNFKSWENYDLQTITNIVSNNGGRSYNAGTCGVHIHRSNRDLSSIDKLKLILFFAQNVNKICKVAQRRNDTFAAFTFFEESPQKGIVYKRMKNGDHRFERYQAINFSNSRTIEFRIFKGSLKVSTIRAYLAWTHYLVEFLKKTLLSDLNPRTCWYDFIAYLGLRSRKEAEAVNLLAYLKAKEVV
jgi:hypothetical protein